VRVGLVVPGFSADPHDWCIPALRNLVAWLARADDVRVIALRYPYAARRYAVFGAEVTALGGGTRQGRDSVHVWRHTLGTLAAEHRRRPFDVLHGFWATESGALAALAGRTLGVPTVVSLAGGELVRFPDIGYGGQLSLVERLKVRLALRLASAVTAGSRYQLALCGGPRPRLRGAPHHPWGGPALRAAAASLAPRGWAEPAGGRRSRLPAGWATPGRPPPILRTGRHTGVTGGGDGGEAVPGTAGGTARCAYLPLGVDTERFRPVGSDAGYVPGLPRLLHVASLTGVKDQALLLDAVAGLRDRGHAFHLEIVGTGPLAGPLRDQARRLGLRGLVAFCGALPHHELPAAYAGAAVLVQSSRHEAQGMAVLEAAAAGLPVVGSAVGVLPELAPDAAVAVPQRDPSTLADAIAGVLDDPDRRLAMGRAARRRVEADFSLDACGARFRALYASLISG
jgi:glycosyltransferase involved in cell wall biosynthesis